MNELKNCLFCGSEANIIYEKCFGYKVFCPHCLTQMPWCNEEALATHQWNRRPEPHKYTLEELRGMEGYPIWLETGEISIGEQVIGEYRILDSVTIMAFWFTQGVRGFLADDYGKTWVAYDRPPEEDSNE